MVNYRNGKIYQLVNDVNSIAYIGSTCQTLCKRMYSHRAEGISLRFKSPIYLAMHEIGTEHFRILLVQNAPCSSREELLAIEYEVAQRYKQKGLFYIMQLLTVAVPKKLEKRLVNHIWVKVYQKQLEQR